MKGLNSVLVLVSELLSGNPMISFGVSVMKKLKLEAGIAQRLHAFINSDQFPLQSTYAKSAYWEHYSSKFSAELNGNSANVGGDSGFYVPQPSSALQKLALRTLSAIKHPSSIGNFLKRSITSFSGTPSMLTYRQAFDAVMSHSEVSDPDLSPFRVNHLQLAKLKGVFATSKAIETHYQEWSGYETSENIIKDHYYQNILLKYMSKAEVNTIMEIGAGNGNFPSILFHYWAPVRCILIDLPETLAIAIPFLSCLFPQARLIMPNEISSEAFNGDFDFAFVTVDQLDAIDHDCVDLSINCHSFQEMTHRQIKVYFDHIQRVTRESGFFFTANRVEKIPCGPDSYFVEQADPPNRFAEYPWSDRNEVLVYEISRLGRLVQLDDTYIRLERIHK